MEVEELQSILKLIKEAIKCLETKSATLADCFIQLIRLSYSIKNLQIPFFDKNALNCLTKDGINLILGYTC